MDSGEATADEVQNPVLLLYKEKEVSSLAVILVGIEKPFLREEVKGEEGLVRRRKELERKEKVK